HPKIRHALRLLVETGLGYLTLGQPSPTLSGGEAQRIKLVTELSRTGATKGRRLREDQRGNFYLLEEPTIGLHMADVEQLIGILHRLTDEGHTVVVIEHNLSVIAEADYVLEIGPEAGAEGGQLVAAGTPEEVSQVKASPTAPFLKPLLKTCEPAHVRFTAEKIAALRGESLEKVAADTERTAASFFRFSRAA
ncbi:MAG: hypothetical protein ACKOEG_08500, partial [Chthoniobacterales bacterium]